MHPPSPQEEATARDPNTEATAEAPQGSQAPHTSYGQILKSSAWIGGSSVATIGIGIVRTKAMAVMLGPSGFGLMGLYGSIIDLALAAASMGVGSSGVRQIAESVASGDQARIARTVVALRRTALVLGVLGAALLAAFSGQVSTLTFGTEEHAGAVALLALAVFFRLVSSGQGALIQGMRRIRDLALMGVLGALFGAVISITLVYILRDQGVAPSLVAGAAMGLIISWWYARQIRIQLPAMSRTEVIQEAGPLLKLGFAFMLSGLLTMGAAFAVRAIILRIDGLEAAGLYSAAWTLGGLYVGIILQAMGADFYPRLIGVADNNQECNRLVNEQTLVSLLLAGPGVIATILFAPLIITLFYSGKFVGAVDVLRWICLGIAMRAITWPMGFILVAKNRQLVFISVDAAWAIFNVALTYICVRSFGVVGAGMAFFGSYVFHMLLVYPLARRLSGFRWSTDNITTGFVILSSTLVVFCGPWALTPVWGIALSSTVLIAVAAFSVKQLSALVPHDRIPKGVLRVLQYGRLA